MVLSWCISYSHVPGQLKIDSKQLLFKTEGPLRWRGAEALTGWAKLFLLFLAGFFFWGGGVRSSKSKNIVLNLVNRHSTKAFFNTQKKLNSNINTFEYLLFRMVSWRYHLFWLLLVLYLKVNAFKSEHHTSVTKKFTSWLLKIHYFKLILIQKLQDSCHLNPFLMWKNILNSICYCRSIYIDEAKNIEKSFLLF